MIAYLTCVLHVAVLAKKLNPPSLKHSRSCLRPGETSMPEQPKGLRADVIDGGLAQEGGSTRQAEFEPSYSAAGRGAAAGISTQTLSREEGATASGSSRYRCERRPGALAAWENDKRRWYTSLEDTQALRTTKFSFIVLASYDGERSSIRNRGRCKTSSWRLGCALMCSYVYHK
jgi:hypothetical protein